MQEDEEEEGEGEVIVEYQVERLNVKHLCFKIHIRFDHHVGIIASTSAVTKINLISTKTKSSFTYDVHNCRSKFPVKKESVKNEI